MCGISGVVSRKETSIVPTFIKMNQIIRHRGPDDEGFVFFDKKLEAEVYGSDDTSTEAFSSNINYCPTKKIEKGKGNYSIGFGHRRLSILDLSPAGHMPMCDATNELWITYNGEVYNFIEIRSELETLGHIFNTDTDTEVILAAYKEWGQSCLNHFMGMFAFAILDVKKKEIFLARDRFGIKPLYYWVSENGNFHFASEIKQFTVIEEWKPKLNHQRAFDYIYGAKTDHTDETMFKDVFQLTPGNSLTLDLNNKDFKALNSQKWYNPKLHQFKGTFEEARDIFKEKFFQSVTMHLRADVKVGCTLSGGFDSSSITSVVNKLLNDKGKIDAQHTFSAIDGDSKYSEKKWIHEVIKKYKVSPHFITPNPEEILFDIGKVIWQMDEPTGSMSPYLGFLVDRLAKENGITVILNGQGADEYLAGYGAFRKIQLQNTLDSLNIKKIKREFNCGFNKAFKLAVRSLARQVYASLFPKKYGKSFSNPLDSKKWFYCLDYKNLNVDTSNVIPKGTPKMPSYLDSSEKLLKQYPLPMFLRWEDRNSMAHSIEARVPFLDHRLVEFAHSLPINYIDVPGQTKRVLLEAMKGIIPDKIYHRKDKMGYVAADERWIKEEYTQTFRDLLKESIEYSKGIIKIETMDYFEDIISGKEKFNFSYWRLLMFGHWMKVFKVDID